MNKIPKDIKKVSQMCGATAEEAIETMRMVSRTGPNVIDAARAGKNLRNVIIKLMKPTEETIKKYLKAYKDIEKIVFNKPATIVYLKTGEKGVAKVREGDVWNWELGFWVAYAKALKIKCVCGQLYHNITGQKEVHIERICPTSDQKQVLRNNALTINGGVAEKKLNEPSKKWPRE